MPALVHCIYTSVQARPLSTAEIAALVEDSRARNRAAGITGLLIHVRNTFFQVLEGPPQIIDALYNKILLDHRHTHITRIIYEAIPRRYFEDTDMSLVTFTPWDLSSLLEENNPERTEQLLSGLDEGRAKRLLRAFSQGRWRSRISAQPERGESVV